MRRCAATCVQTGNLLVAAASKEQRTAMMHKSKYLYVALVASLALFLTSCYPAHSGSGGGLNGGGGGNGGGNGGGGGNNGNPSTFTIGGSVIGLAGTGLVLQDNGGDDLPIV